MTITNVKSEFIWDHLSHFQILKSAFNFTNKNGCVVLLN